MEATVFFTLPAARQADPAAEERDCLRKGSKDALSTLAPCADPSFTSPPGERLTIADFSIGRARAVGRAHGTSGREVPRSFAGTLGLRRCRLGRAHLQQKMRQWPFSSRNELDSQGNVAEEGGSVTAQKMSACDRAQRHSKHRFYRGRGTVVAALRTMERAMRRNNEISRSHSIGLQVRSS